MWTVILCFRISCNHITLLAAGRRVGRPARLVACVIVVLIAGFVQGNLTMPDSLESCTPGETGNCPKYHYCSQRSSMCEPCSSCSNLTCGTGWMKKCMNWPELGKSRTTYMLSPGRLDLSPSCNATELQRNVLLSANCTRHCIAFNSSLLCFFETKCRASCMPIAGRSGWLWESSCECQLVDDNKLACDWTTPLPSCANATATASYGTTEYFQPTLPTLAYNDPADKTTVPVIAASVGVVIVTGTVAAISVLFRRHLARVKRKKFVTDEGHSCEGSMPSGCTERGTAAKHEDEHDTSVEAATCNDGVATAHASGTASTSQMTVINNSTHYTNVLVAEVGSMSVGGSGSAATRPAVVRQQDQDLRHCHHCPLQCSCRQPACCCGHRRCLQQPSRVSPHVNRPPQNAGFGCSTSLPAESRHSAVRVANAVSGVGGQLRYCRCRPGRSRKPPIADGCGCIDGCPPDGKRDNFGDCSRRPLLSPPPVTAYFAGGGLYSHDQSDVEVDAVSEVPQPSSGPCSRLTERDRTAADACSVCSSGCLSCSCDGGDGCLRDGAGCVDNCGNCDDDRSACESHGLCESNSSSGRGSSEVMRNQEGPSDISARFLESATILDPASNVCATTQSQSSPDCTIIKVGCVGLLELIPTEDATRAGSGAVHLELDSVGLLRVGPMEF